MVPIEFAIVWFFCYVVDDLLFQQQVIDHIITKPDGRTLNWYHEEDGNIGKSYLTKYVSLVLHLTTCLYLLRMLYLTWTWG